ncbi:MAG: hypothetical protein IPM29_26565 [Planctomycetes bacterium]|nr:hypothetical protein [Planctomycetota bacterium]
MSRLPTVSAAGGLHARRYRSLFVASCATALLTACAGGSSGDGEPGGSGGPSGRRDPGAPFALVLTGDPFAESGRPFAARIEVIGNDTPDPLGGGGVAGAGLPPGAAVSVVRGPDGLTIAAATGEVAWTPRADQAGTRELEVQVALGPLQVRETLEVLVQGRAREAEGAVSARAGGVVAVDRPGSVLAGTRLVFPPGALASDQTITIDSLTEPVRLPTGALGIELEPSQAFLAPVTVELTYPADLPAALGVADGRGLGVYHRDDVTGTWSAVADVQVDPAQRRLTFPTAHFSSFAVYVGDPRDPGYGDGDALLRLWRTFVAGSDAPAPDDASQYLGLNDRLWQQPELVQVQGAGFRPGQKNALLIHGLFSHGDNFAALQSWARARYDNVVFYNYPSGAPIRHNARWLAVQLLLQDERFVRGSCIDVYAHSMGGVVARAVVEDPSMWAARVLFPFVHVVTLGTPHLGGDVEVPPALARRLTPGIRDLVPGSEFLGWLNGDPGQGWSTYIPIAGDTGAGHDGIVAVSSAIPANVFTIAHSEVFRGQGHSDLHVQIATNGVGALLSGWVRPRMIREDLVRLESRAVVVRHAALAPSEYESHWEQVDADATLALDPDLFVPPFIPIAVSWEPVDGQGASCSLGLDKAHQFFDGSPPGFIELLRGILGGRLFSDDPELDTTMHAERPRDRLAFRRRLRDVSVCPPPGWIPRPGVHVPPPEFQIRIRIGFGDDAIVDKVVR